jgi:non-ribosomal peptide synthetase component F
LFTLLSATLAGVLLPFCNQREMLLGSSVSVRNQDSADCLGFFANTIVVRCSAAGQQMFSAQVRELRQALAAAMPHFKVPFQKLVETLRPARSSERHPLFQVMLNFHAFSAEIISRQKDVIWYASQSPYELDVHVYETPEGLQARFATNSTSRFLPSLVRTLATTFIDALARLALSGLDVPFEAMLRAPQALETLSVAIGPALQVPQGSCYGLISAQFQACASKPAFVLNGRSVSYEALANKAEGLAEGMHRSGLRPGHTVALLLPRSVDFVLLMLACMRLGVTYVPLDPFYPDGRLQHILRQSGAHLLVADNNVTVDRLRALDLGSSLVILAVAQLVQFAVLPLPEASVSGDLAAYVLFTSGSSGQPKGVEVSHSCLSNFLLGLQSKAVITGSDTVLALTSFTFDICAVELWLPLMCGASIVLLTDSGAALVPAISCALSSSAVTVVQATPSLWQQLLADDFIDVGMLRVALCGGEEFTRRYAFIL